MIVCDGAKTVATPGVEERRSLFLGDKEPMRVLSVGVFLASLVSTSVEAQVVMTLPARDSVLEVQLERYGEAPMAPVRLSLGDLPIGTASWSDRVIVADEVGNRVGVRSGVWLEVHGRDTTAVALKEHAKGVRLLLRWRIATDVRADDSSSWHQIWVMPTVSWQCLAATEGRICLRWPSGAPPRP